MLDEKHEYELYTCNPTQLSELLRQERHRLRRYTFLKDNFSGYPRAMEIIARKHLFDDDNSEWPDSSRMRGVEIILRHWCGDFDPEQEALISEYEHLECWVEKYIDSLCRHEGLSSKRVQEGWRKKVRPKNGKGLRASVCDCDDQWVDDRNRTTYQRVIANALREGPLKTRYLAGDGKKLGDVRMDKRSRYYVLGITAAFLLQGDYDRSEGFVRISPGRIRDWLGVDANRWSVNRWVYRGNPLFEWVSLGKSQSLWHIDKQWLDDGRWRLIDAYDIDAVRSAARNNLTIYGDVPCTISLADETASTVEVVDIRL